MKRLSAFFPVLTCSLFQIGAALAAQVDPNNPAQGRFLDEWAEVYMAGGKVGYMHYAMAREGDLIHTQATTQMKIGRADSPVDIRMVQTTTETLAGVPVTFSSEMDLSLIKTSTKGTVKNGRVTIVSSQYGMEQTQTLDYPKGAVMAWGMFRESLLRGFKPGTEYTLDTYTPELRLDGAVSAATKVGDWEEFEHRGKRQRGQRVSVTLKSLIGSIESVSWVDRNGWALKAVISTGFGDMVVLTTDQQTALTDFVPPEIFMKTVIKAGRTIDAKSTNRVKYRVRATKPDIDLTGLPTTGMQAVGEQTDRWVELVVTRQRHKTNRPQALARADSRATNELQADELAEYLESNLMINTADPKLIELARRAAGGETDPYALADKLRRFVTDYVEAKTLNVGFATASEVCRTKEGDCSEHSVLLAALGRLNRLPSRVVVGLAYVPVFGGQDDIFGYHMWTQFYIDGRWIDVDAALKETVCSPTRIAFAASSLKNTGLADLSLPLLFKIGAIDIDILEVE